ncbi:site-specific DNA-methyltransferase [Caproiciproducens faecalis]|uniref:Site-specific DNA-methyltransferase n=1 Tax=Caproiciproducens faecalis TaxID=2820301 RepID=A0ABS7DMG2_9FIRM|nr:site-specific DNA-methyltransferase [Caproiciproducens faecalis]MBW7572490.1 site-specific DNA-methyltransferase [Caproiciproducens faecalis]
MDKFKMESVDMTEKNIEKIAALFPNVMTEMEDENGKLKKGINFELLKQELSGDVIDGEECYDFTWVGKKASIVEGNKPIRKTLRPCKEESKDWENTENLYIEGDNLDVLKLLQESYLNSIKMIYIDPPYNTGNDFIYKDDFTMDKGEYDEQTGLYDEDENRLFQNNESNGRFHSDWCSMLYPRLQLARNLLANDGAVFISIDDNEVDNLKKICDEVFGEVNFVAKIAALNNPKGRSQDKYVATCHEYLLIYSKMPMNKGAFSIPKTKEDIEKDYTLIDEAGLAYRELELRNTHRDFGRFNRPNLFYPFFVNNNGEVFLEKKDIETEVYPIWDDGFEGCWTWGKDKAKEEIHLLIGKVVNGQWKVYRKAYASINQEEPLKQVKSIWTNKKFHTEKGQATVNYLFQTKEKYFQSPKSVDYICECILMSHANSNDIVLDFFSGSATTAHAVMQLNAENGGNRKFIMVQLPEPCDKKSEAYKAGYKNICEIGKERIRRAGEMIKSEVEESNKQLKLGEEPKKVPDIGFRVLKLDSTNMKDVYYGASEYDQTMLDHLVSNVKDDRTDMDLLYGVLLEWGLPLSLPHKMEQINGVTVHTVNEGDLIACFANKIDESVIREIAKRQPLRAVFRDSSFVSSPDKINVEEIFKLAAPKTTVKVI